MALEARKSKYLVTTQVEILCDIKAQVQLAGESLNMKVSVSGLREAVGCYMGMNFFEGVGCDFSVTTESFNTVSYKFVYANRGGRAFPVSPCA